LTDIRGAVVDQDVDGTKSRLGLADCVFQVFLAADVALNRRNFAGQPGELLGGRLENLQFAARDDNAGAGFYKPTRNRLANAAATPGHKGDFAV
jgi:hypothetical protein